jgi:hypothetical protein
VTFQPWDTGEDDHAPEPKFEYEEVPVTGILSVRAQQVSICILYPTRDPLTEKL